MKPRDKNGCMMRCVDVTTTVEGEMDGQIDTQSAGRLTGRMGRGRLSLGC